MSRGNISSNIFMLNFSLLEDAVIYSILRAEVLLELSVLTIFFETFKGNLSETL